MKEFIQKESWLYKLPFDLCRAGKTLAVMLSMFAVLALFAYAVENHTQVVAMTLFVGGLVVVLLIVTAIIYEVVGPCKK